MKTPYQILGISPSASLAKIKEAYYAKAKEYHPDRHEGDEKMAKRFIAASRAYNFLSTQENTKRESKKTDRAKNPVTLDDWAAGFDDSLESWTDITTTDGKFRTDGDWTVSELEEKLMEFYGKYGIDTTIAIYSRHQRFQADGVRYWKFLGLIEAKRSWTGEQEGEIQYGLTDAGIEFIERKRIGE